jgi:hypothetical protein
MYSNGVQRYLPLLPTFVMGMIDQKISVHDEKLIIFFIIFIDDIIIGTVKEFLDYMNTINNLYDKIKFKYSNCLKD